MSLRYWEYPECQIIATFIVGGSTFSVLADRSTQEEIWETAKEYSASTWGAKYLVKWASIVELSPEVYEDILSKKWFDIEVD